jgi:hypothetical protein
MKLLVAIVLLGLTSACPNYAAFQEADTLPPGVTKIGVGATATTYKEVTGTELDSVFVPAVNAWYRRGLIGNLEGHASVWIPLGSSVGLKYQLTGNREMAGLSFSLGLDLGVLQSSSTDEMDNETTSTTVDTYLPVYVGYRTGPGLALYAVPKYILRTYSNDAGTSFGHLVGATGGVALGAKTTLHLEGSYFYDFDLEAPALQGGIGIAF